MSSFSSNRFNTAVSNTHINAKQGSIDKPISQQSLQNSIDTQSLKRGIVSATNLAENENDVSYEDIYNIMMRNE